MSDRADDDTPVRRAPSGALLTRRVAFQFSLDPTVDQEQLFLLAAGAARFTFNHHVAAVKANLTCRSHQRAFGMPAARMSPALSWSKSSRIKEFNAWKNGRAHNSPTDENGTPGLAWRSAIPADVFECASRDAGQALLNYSESAAGTRAGIRKRFPRFKARHKTSPRFRLRSKGRPGQAQSVRFIDAHHLKLNKLGTVRVLGSTRRVRRMLNAGTFHIHSAAVSRTAGRWKVSLSGVATEFHHQHPRRSPSKPNVRVGADFGFKLLAVAAAANGSEVRVWEGVNALRAAQTQLRRANKTHARTKPGSRGRSAAKLRLQKLHARIARIRRHVTHDVSTWMITNCDSVVVEDLNVAGMRRLRPLAMSATDAGLGTLRRTLEYKAGWYGTELVVADRWFPSSKTCSSCGHVKDELALSERTYHCDSCNLRIDRDFNAAINLARYESTAHPQPAPILAAV